jgi:porin
MAFGEPTACDFDRAAAAGSHSRRAPCLLVALAAITVASATVAFAQSNDEDGRIPGIPEPSIASSLPRELGDPGGVRSALGQRGIKFGVNYIGEVLGNPTGGVKQGTFYDGRLELALEADLEKTIGWPGLSVFVNAYQIHGFSLSANNLGVLMPVSFIEALPDTRLFELWLEQKLFDGKLSIRFGQLSADSDFLISQGAQAFLNGTWGWASIAGVNLPDGGPSYPMAAPGVRVLFAPDDHFSLRVGLYTGDPADDCAEGVPQKCNANGLAFPFSDPLLLVEGAYRYNQGEGKLAGTFKLGSWRLFSAPEQQSFGNNALPIALPAIPGEFSDQDYAIYAILDQMLYRLPGKGDPKGISVFGRAATAPSEGNMIETYWEAGLTFSGLSATRPDDVLGIGLAHTGVSSETAAFERDAGGTIIPDFERMLEVSYTAQIVKGFYLQPDFQYFWNPGGRVPDPDDPAKAVPNAAVLGLRTTINY